MGTSLTFRCYIVGGAVRDRLLGLPVHDRDWVVVGASSEILLKAGFIAVGRDFPVFLHPQTKEEYALARTERKTARGYRGFVINASPDVTLEEDLSRRDLTINAMAQTESGELIDPYGGVNDLKAGILRHVSPAFCEDPVRVLRAARFAARFGFKLADETRQLIEYMGKSGELEALVPERVWQELSRALMNPMPSQFFLLLKNAQVLDIIFPEVAALFGVPQSPTSHPEIDCGDHVMRVLEQTARLNLPLAARVAALCHDFGKALTPKEYLPKHPEHETRGLECVKQFCKRLRIPKDIETLATLTTRYHGDVHRAFQLSAEEVLTLLQKFDARRQPERWQQFLNVCLADTRGRKGFETVEFPQRDRLLHTQTLLNALDIQSLIAHIPPNERATHIQHAQLQLLRQFLQNTPYPT